MRGLNDRYAGALAFDSTEEQQKLVQQGFPMPEEWLAAQRMPDAELEALANEGNIKAQMINIDRVSSQIGAVRATGRGLTTSQPDMALFNRVTAANTTVLELMRRTKSPFAAYLDGQINSAMSQGNPAESMASAIMLAGDLGDRRADSLLTTYMHAHPGMNAGTITSRYSGMKRLILGP